ncbi:hypothetical protein P7C70_g4803, partial [Phenoliferia sp. Uapishka_3]
MKPSTPIQWKSDDKNLAKLAPRVDLEDLDDDAEFDENKGIGSFFTYFSIDGEDEQDLGEALLEWRAHALEYATGSDSDWGSDDEDDEEEEKKDGDKMEE